jgi:hypothetical protein
MRWPAVLFVALVALLGAGWFLLAVVCFVYPALPVRVVLALLTGVVFVAGFVWYAVASWRWRMGSAGLDQLVRPATLFLFGWLLCLGSALAAGFALKIEPRPAPPPTQPSTTTKPTTAGKLFARGPRRYLADMEEFDVKTNEWGFRKDGTLNDKTAILVEGKISPKGLSMHPPDNGYSSVKYRLNDEAAVFRGKAAIDDTGAPLFAPGHFEVLGDGVTLWKSKEFKHEKRPPEECNISVAGVRTLELRYYSPSFKHGQHAVWVEPRVLQSADTPDEP